MFSGASDAETGEEEQLLLVAFLGHQPSCCVWMEGMRA